MKCCIEEGRESGREKGERSKGKRRKNQEKKSREEESISFSMIKAMNVERTAFSYSVSELLTESGLKQNQNQREERQTSFKLKYNVEELTQFPRERNCYL